MDPFGGMITCVCFQFREKCIKWKSQIDGIIVNIREHVQQNTTRIKDEISAKMNGYGPRLGQNYTLEEKKKKEYGSIYALSMSLGKIPYKENL